MSVLNILTLLLNGFTLSLALAFLLIVLWHDVRKEVNQFFATFLFLVIMWNLGSLIALGVSVIDQRSVLMTLAVGIMELGFTGACVAIYALTAVLVGVHTRRFRLLAFISLILVVGYQLFLIVNATPVPVVVTPTGFLQYRFQPLAAMFYFAFDGVTAYLLWRYRRKIRSRALIAGLVLFLMGQSLGFLNPSLGMVSISVNVSSVATLIISFALLRLEIITPLAERIAQLEAVHKVSLAITSQLHIDTVLQQIATQAAGWLNADAAGIFLTTDRDLELATAYNLPTSYVHSRIAFGQGVAGTVAQTRQSIYLENYSRDWKQQPDLPLAHETFGSVISVPLIYGSRAIGTLLVVAGRQGRLFQPDDVRALELLGAQAAVAIAHSHYFNEQHKLTQQIDSARSQLETVLTSTENPVIAVDRKLHLIFANPAAWAILPATQNSQNQSIQQWLPNHLLPTNLRNVLHNLHTNRAYTYEANINQRVYSCHLAQLGRPRAAGWVAILNDITELKELDRLKSEMVRMTSHDLKNPLQAAIANLDLLSEDLSETNNDEIRTSINNINKQLIRMNRIISGILDLERVKSGGINLEICYPAEIIANTIEELEHLADDNQIKLTSTIERPIPCFLADTEQFKRALINLVENGIKFTHPSGEVIIRARSENDKIIFEVEDTGIGIPEGLHSQIFERFLRGSQMGQEGAEHISGSGLGLSLVKAIVENHHGQIWLKSQVGTGTIFFVSLPSVAVEAD